MGTELNQGAANAAADVALGAKYLLRCRLLDDMDRALAARGVCAMLVKGAAIAERYDKPWQRDMADIDLLVREVDAAAVAAALRAAGLAQQPYEQARLHSQHLFFEENFLARRGGASLLVEVHTQLDKLVPRPIDYHAVFERAELRSPKGALLIPADEDHLLLVVLHLATSDYAHPAAWHDLALLWKPPLNVDLVLERARHWRLSSALHLTLRLMERRGIEVAPEHLQRTCPPDWRSAALSHVFMKQTWLPEERTLGWPWIARQTLLRDDLLRWVSGVAGYARLRALDRVLGGVRSVKP